MTIYSPIQTAVNTHMYGINLRVALQSRDEYVDQFVPNAPFLYPLKTSGNRKVHWEQMG